MDEDPLAPAVAGALTELRVDFGAITVEPDGRGGAYVTVLELDAGPRWRPMQLELALHLPFNYPFSAVYPFYTTDELERAEGGMRPPALQTVEWRGRRVTQVSLRANRWRPEHDTASGAVAQVRHWFQLIA